MEEAQLGLPTRHRPSDFAAYCVPGRIDAEAATEAFRNLFDRDPDLRLASGTWTVLLALDGPASVGSDPGGDVSVLLHGETYEPAPSTAAALAERYAAEGDQTFARLNGSFALLVLDRRNDRILVVPDRVASRRVFVSRDRQGIRLSTRLFRHPTDDRPLDPVGVGWHLSSGTYFTGRTPFEGVRVLPRAHAHELGPTEVESRRYWSHAVLDEPDVDDPEELAARYEEALVEAVRRRVGDGDDVWMSLSAGYDCRMIAAILVRRLDVEGIRSFSYARMPIRPGTDPALAGEIARRLGFRHHTWQSYNGPYLDFLAWSAHLGEGLISGHEADGWPGFGPVLEQSDRPVILTGDEYLGMDPFDVPTRAAWRSRMRMRGLDFSAGVRRRLPRGLLVSMREGLAADADRILDEQPPTRDYWQAYACAAFDQRCANVILPWRESFAGRWGRVRNPWLDRDVLDMGARIGWENRAGKKLFLQVLARIDPDLAALPREDDEGYRADYGQLARENAQPLLDWLESTESRLDELLPVSFGRSLIRDAARVRGRSRVARLSRAVRRRLSSEPLPVVQPPGKYVRRYATLRMALGAMPATPWPGDLP